MLTLAFLVTKILGVLTISWYWIILVLLIDLYVRHYVLELTENIYVEGLEDGRMEKEVSDLENISTGKDLAQYIKDNTN